VLSFVARADRAGVSRTPALPAVVDQRLAELPHDERQSWQAPGFAIHAARQRTGGRKEGGAVLLTADGCGLAFDGRIDERASLAAELGEPPDARSDGQLVLACHRRFGVRGLERLRGAFALVLWDGVDGSAVALRDRSGVRPLYWSSQDDHLWLASDPRLLLAAGVAADVDEVAVAERLAGEVLGQRRTLHRRIARLEPGHALSLQRGRFRHRLVHGFELSRSESGGSDGTHVEHFDALLTRAVARCCSSQAPVAVELSGGLDSSTVCVVADEIAGRGRLGAPALVSCSLVFPAMRCDETPFIDAVRERLSFDGLHCEPTLLDPPQARVQARRRGDVPDYPNGAMGMGMYRTLVARGCRVALGGVGGDEWLAGGVMQAADAFAAGRWARGFELLGSPQASAFARARRLLSVGLWPQLPVAWRATLRTLRDAPSLPDWLRPELVSATALRERLRWPVGGWSAASHAQRATLQGALRGWMVHALEMEARAAAELGLELRQPLCDAELVDFALSAPARLWFDGGERKALLRRVMRHRLPELVRTRRSKAEFSEIYAGVLAAFPQAVDLSDGQLERRGWIDARRFATAVAHQLERARAGRPDGEALHLLWCAFALELWLRALDA
jgi:asparagine synthase (glutamine-hydrolysing)